MCYNIYRKLRERKTEILTKTFLIMRLQHRVGERGTIMAKLSIEVSKQFGVLRAKSTMREDLTTVIMNALNAYYGENASSMVRVNSPTTGKGENLIGVNCADVSEDGGIFDGCATVKITVKDWCDRVGQKTTKAAWDYEGAKDAYAAWEEEQAQKEAEKAAKKAANKVKK